jgi:hypothetical protein
VTLLCMLRQYRVVQKRHERIFRLASVDTLTDLLYMRTTFWVRFGGTATRMATTPPQIYRCATSATGWYTGTLPSTVGVIVTGVVCYTWTSSICDFHNTVSVINCNGFYIYLLDSPSQCSLRYCSE